MNHYETLEVSRTASPEVIRAAYRSLMQRFHPDKNPGDAAVAARAAAISHAYDVLSDAAKRADYDRSLQVASIRPAVVGGSMPVPRRAPAAREQPGASGWGLALWLPVIALTVALAWGLASFSGKLSPKKELASLRDAFSQADATEARKRELLARKEAVLAREPELLRADADEKAEDIARRAVNLLKEPLKVRLVKKTPTGDEEAAANLTLPAIRLVVGTFDAPSMVAHIEKHRERLLQDLSERLGKQSFGAFAGPDGEPRLRAMVLDTVLTSLGTDARQEYPSTWFESPGRHGVVSVILPDRFELVQVQQQ